MEVRGEGDFGWFEGETRMRYKGDPISIRAHPMLLKEIVDKAGEMGIGENMLVFHTDEYRHYVRMLMED